MIYHYYIIDPTEDETPGKLAFQFSMVKEASFSM